MPHFMLQTGDRLEVVVEDVGLSFEHDVDQIASTVEIWREHFNGEKPARQAHGQDATAEVFGAAVRQVVAGYGGDDNVAQPQAPAGLGQTLRLIDRDRTGSPAPDRAEAARPGADIAQDHERRRAAGPALRAVRAPCTLADGFEAKLADQAPREGNAARRGDRPLEPFRQPAPDDAIERTGILIRTARRCRGVALAQDREAR